MKPGIHIVTGDVNAGKTTFIKKLFQQQAAVSDGVLSEKIFRKERFLGYRLVHLRSGNAMDLVLVENEYHQQFSEACRLGVFVFSSEAFLFGTKILMELCADPTIGTVFLDEAGPLELHGQGFAGILPALLHAEKELYITVRSDCLREFLRIYSIDNHQIIKVPIG